MGSIQWMSVDLKKLNSFSIKWELMQKNSMKNMQKPSKRNHRPKSKFWNQKKIIELKRSG